MKNNKLIIKQLNNAKGKRLLERTKLEYSKEIILQLGKNPNIVPELLNELEITQEDFFNYLSGKYNANITLYDQTLTTAKEKIKKIVKEKEVK